MRWKFAKLTCVLATAAIFADLSTQAQTQPSASPPAAATQPVVPGWNEFVHSLRTLPDRMLAKLPLEERNDGCRRTLRSSYPPNASGSSASSARPSRSGHCGDLTVAGHHSYDDTASLQA